MVSNFTPGFSVKMTNGHYLYDFTSLLKGSKDNLNTHMWTPRILER